MERLVMAAFLVGALAAAEDGAVVEVVHGVRVRRRRPGVGVHSELAGGRACLTTQATGSLPTGPRKIRRVLPGADVEGLIRQHRADLAVLADRGLSPNPVRDAEDALRVRRMAYEQQEAALRAHPLRAAFTTFVSRMTGWNLDTTPLWDRPDIHDRIAALAEPSGPDGSGG